MRCRVSIDTTPGSAFFSGYRGKCILWGKSFRSRPQKAQPRPDLRGENRQRPEQNCQSNSAELRELFGMRDKFGVGASAEFVEVEALPFPFRNHAQRPEAIQGQV
jgi:hypothetical protein